MEEGNKPTVMDKAKETAKNVAKDAAKNVAKQGAKHVIKVAAQAIGSFIIAHLPIIIIIIVVFVLVNNLFNIFVSIGSIISDFGQGIIDFFTSEDEEEINNRVDQFIEQLESSGIDLDAMKLSGEIDYSDPNREEAIQKAKRKYIKKFLEAQAVTQTINKTSNQSGEGRVYVYRNTPNANVVDNSSSTRLHYVSMEELENLKVNAESNGNYDSILNYFSINESNQIVVPEIVTTETSQDGETPTTTTTITLRGKDYINLISPYSTSAQLFIYLGLIVQNPEFLAAFSDLVKDSEIEITLLDNTTRTETEEVYTYIQHTRVIDYEEDEETGELVEVGSHFEEEEVTQITNTVTTTITPSIYVTYAKTWVAEQSIVYKKNPDQTPEPIENVSRPGNESPSSSYKTDQIITTTETTTTSSWDSGTPSEYVDRTGEKDANGNWNKDSILGLLTTQYRLPNSTREEAAIYNLESGANWLFELLKQDQTTQTYEQVMRYILYKYTGDDKYGVTQLDFSIFNPNYMQNYVGSVYGNTAEEKVWYSLRNMGLSEYAVAGVMGNIYAESGFDTSAIEYETGEGIGLCQWSFGRREGLESYAESKGKTWEDVDIQVQYLMAELTVGGGANGFATYNLLNYNGYTANDWKNATSASDAATAFCYIFERPSEPNLDVRKDAAERYYNEFKGKEMVYPADSITVAGYTFPHYLQRNYDHIYGTSNIERAGCGPTSLAMLLSGLLGNPSITPITVVENMEAYFPSYTSYYMPNVGTIWGGMLNSTLLQQYYGVKATYVSDIEYGISQVESGKVALGGCEGHILAIVPVPEQYQGQGYRFYIMDSARGLDGPYRSAAEVRAKSASGGVFNIRYIIEPN